MRISVMDEKRAIAALGALAQETRLALFRLLVTAGPKAFNVSTMAKEAPDASGGPVDYYKTRLNVRSEPLSLAGNRAD
jgi:ArsR family transcriptional regulator